MTLAHGGIAQHHDVTLALAAKSFRLAAKIRIDPIRAPAPLPADRRMHRPRVPSNEWVDPGDTGRLTDSTPMAKVGAHQMGGRPRAFDEQTVLERAMELFWRDGYAATSLQALLSCMGISRQSLYNAFGDKRNLYLACLDHYIERRAGAMLAGLEAPDAGYAAVVGFFEGLRQMKTEPSETPRTCLIGRSCVELGADDPAVAERVQAHMRRTMRAFRNALKNAVARGEVEPLDPDAVSRHLTATLHGLGLMLRAGATMEELGGAVRVALSVIRPTAASAEGRAVNR